MNLIGTPAAAARWLGAWWSRLIAGLAFAVVAGVTGRISYVHIQALSLALHQSPGNAQLMPFGVDGLIVVGSMALLQAPDDQGWLGWVCVAPGGVASLVANVMSGIRFGWPSAAWAGVASAAFILATFTLERWLKSQFRRPTHGGSGTPGELLAGALPTPVREGDPGVPHPLDTMALLRLLLASESDRNLAFALKVDRNKIRAWQSQVDAADADPGENEPAEVPETQERSLNGSGAHA